MSDEDTGAVSQQELADLKSTMEQEASALKTGMLAERDKRHTLEVEIATLKGQQKVEPKTQDISRTDLRRQVDDGSLTEDQMSEILERQSERRIRQETALENAATVSASVEQGRLQAEIDKYIAFKPELRVDGSKELLEVGKEAAVQAQFTGQATNSFVTQVAALRAVYGPSDQLQAATKPAPETHEEGGGDDGDAEIRQDGTAKGLTKRERDFCERQVESGVYKTMDEATAARVKWANPEVRRRHGARV